MTPYYQKNDITLYHGNCTEILPEIGSTDCILTSPPYNMRTRIRNGKYTERETGEHFCKKYDGFGDALPIEEYYETHKKVIEQALLISPILFINIQIVTGSKEAWFRLIGEFSKNLKDIIIWDKGFGQPAMHKKVLNRASELILIFESPATAGRVIEHSNFERGTLSDIWRLGRGGKGKIKGHGAVFPETLPETILTNFTQENDLIVDPFCGTGTSLIVAKKMNRRAIGIELTEKFCEITAKRLEEVTI